VSVTCTKDQVWEYHTDSVQCDCKQTLGLEGHRESNEDANNHGNIKGSLLQYGCMTHPERVFVGHTT